MLAQLRQRELLKGECGECSYKTACSGCRGRAYEETGDMMATDPGCWLTTGLVMEARQRFERIRPGKQ